MELPAKYTEIKELAPGQNARVFSARDTLLDRCVFLKAYKVPEDDPESALREPQMLEALAHKNLTKIHSADQLSDGYLLLGMELVSGGSFKDIIDRSDASGQWISTHRVLNLVADAANGLGHLHSKHFVHRDVKPANLMRREQAQAEQGVVTDLGLASRLDENGKAYASQHALLYRPPEVWEGHGYTPGSDIYQLGIVLYQMLGGTFNYALGQQGAARVEATVTANLLLDYSTLGPHVSKALQRVIKNCVCPIASRFASMSDVIVQLHNLRTKEPDWFYSRSDAGLGIIRDDGDSRVHKFKVTSVGDRHSVEREKQVKGGSYRRQGRAVALVHKNLAACREFVTLLNS